jgi:methylated-DNA-[protein]-cysteine S-methyltransferase
MDISDFEKQVYEACKLVPKGSVVTYSEIARAIGSPHSMRAVGNALNKNPFKTVPCHRVIRNNGSAGGFTHGTRKKVELLKKEIIQKESF